MNRDDGGHFVRLVWIDYCLSIGDTKPSHIAQWEEISERDREADRVIYERVAELVTRNRRAHLSAAAEAAFREGLEAGREGKYHHECWPSSAARAALAQRPQ